MAHTWRNGAPWNDAAAEDWPMTIKLLFLSVFAEKLIPLSVGDR